MLWILCPPPQMFAALIQQRMEHSQGMDRLVFFETCVQVRRKLDFAFFFQKRSAQLTVCISDDSTAKTLSQLSKQKRATAVWQHQPDLLILRLQPARSESVPHRCAGAA